MYEVAEHGDDRSRRDQRLTAGSVEHARDQMVAGSDNRQVDSRAGEYLFAILDDQFETVEEVRVDR